VREIFFSIRDLHFSLSFLLHLSTKAIEENSGKEKLIMKEGKEKEKKFLLIVR
jgi:hypothetical protein